MLVRLLLIFTLVPLAELALLIQIGNAIGVGATVGLVILTGVVGAWLTRLEGLRVLRRVQEELRLGRVPTEQLLDGMLILLAGAVLLTPGLITDTLGVFLLIPQGRRIARKAVAAAFARRLGPTRPPTIDVEFRSDDRG